MELRCGGCCSRSLACPAAQPCWRSEPLDYSGTLPTFSPDAEYLASAVGLQLVVREAESLRVGGEPLRSAQHACQGGAQACTTLPQVVELFACQGPSGAAGLVPVLGEGRLPPARAGLPAGLPHVGGQPVNAQ